MEKHLRALAVHASISLDHDGAPKRADRLNAELAGAGCYAQLDQKSVTAWLDLRNKAAHGHHEAFTAEQVGTMLAGVREFMSRCDPARFGVHVAEQVRSPVSKPKPEEVLERAVRDAMPAIPGAWSWPAQVFEDRGRLRAWFAAATRDDHGAVLLPCPVNPTPGIYVHIPKACLVAAKKALIEEAEAEKDDPLAK